MKILYASGGPRVSTRKNAELFGAKNHVMGVIKGFKSLGHTVHEFIVGDKISEKLTSTGSEKAISNSCFRNILGDVLRILYSIKYSLLLYTTTKNDHYDIVYERLSLFNFLGVFVKNKKKWIVETNAPLSYEARFDRKSLFFYRIARYIEHKCYIKADRLVVISESLKNIIMEQFPGIPPEKFIVLPNGVDVDTINPEITKKAYTSDIFTIGCVGTLYPWIGLDLLLQTILELPTDIKVRLDIVGEGLIKRNLMHFVQEHKMDNVTFSGRITWPEVAEYIKSFDLCYSGQTQHGIGIMYSSPIKLYEYMAMGKPVIASAYDDAKALIQDGIDGFLFEPNNSDNLKENLIKAYYKAKDINPAIIRNKIVSYHSWEKRVETLLKNI